MKISYLIIIFIILPAIALEVLVIAWLTYPYKIVEFKSITLPKTEYRVGEPLHIRIDYCKYKNLSAETTIQYIDEIIYTLPTYKSNSPASCKVIISGDTFIPKSLIPSVYYYRQTMVYKPNPIREITVVFETPKFKVVK